MKFHRTCYEDNFQQQRFLSVSFPLLCRHRRALLSAAASLKDALIAPFAEIDQKNLGVLKFDSFYRMLRNIGCTLTFGEVKRIGGR
jgi:hypothetical protein